MLLLARLGLLLAKLFMFPPLNERKKLPSICDGAFGVKKIPVTRNVVSPFVLLLTRMVLFSADCFPKSFAAIASLTTTEFGAVNAVAGFPSLKGYLMRAKKLESASKPFCS